MPDTDRRIAERLEPVPNPGPQSPWRSRDTLTVCGEISPRSFSISWADAGWLLEAMEKRGYDFSLYPDGGKGGTMCCEIRKWETFNDGVNGLKERIANAWDAFELPGPAAIAQAALKALEEEHDA